ncbi:MAG: hypothetical protein GX605_13290 [Chloroflexi bacterium]|nr:hypothetical protein [Chloroflexota bacterium]
MARTLAVMLAAVLLLGACAPPPAADPTPVTPLRLQADASAYPLCEHLRQAWASSGAAAPLEVRESNAALALEDLKAGRADLVATCWKPRDDQASPLTPAAAWRWTPFAHDALVVLVNLESPVEGLTLGQLRDVFSGRMETWLELTEDPEEIMVVSREDGAGARLDFEAQVMAGRRVTPAAVVMPSGRAVVEFVAEHRGAVGYASLSQAAPGVRAIALDEVLPTLQTVRDGRYPLPGLCYLVLPASGSPRADEWVRFATGEAGQGALERFLKSLEPAAP